MPCDKRTQAQDAPHIQAYKPECVLSVIHKKDTKMGYSTPKKQLDLKEFLSTPAKRLPYKKKFSQVQVAQKTQDGTEQNENETK